MNATSSPPLPDGRIDTLGVHDALAAVPAAVAAALDAGPVDGLPPVTDIDHVVLVPAPAVRAAAAIVAALAAPVSPVPVLVAAAGPVPAWVTGRTLAVRLAAVGGAAPSDVGAATVVDLVADVPGGGIVERLAVAPLVVRALQVLEQLGAYAESAATGSAAADQLAARWATLADGGGPMAKLARRVGRTLPLVYGSDPLAGTAAERWKDQVNLSAKAASFAGSLPGLADAEVSGWGQHGDMTRQVFSLVTLRHDAEADGVDADVVRMHTMLDEVVHEWHEVRGEGAGTLAQILDLVFQGDVFAFHLAQELEIDPGPTAAVF